MKNRYLVLILLSLNVLFVTSQEVINIWSLSSPLTSNGLGDQAELTVYLPQKTNTKKNAAVLICPGGGYAGVSMANEGHAFAKWISQQGLVGIVLKYRLPNKHKEIPFEDAERAMLIINENSDKWNINIEKIGIAGFSAGGHLAAVYSSSSKPIRPNFTILFYPVITCEELTKGGTRNNLLGENPSSKDIIAYSANLQVTEATPSTIIFTADDDPSVPSLHSVKYYNALKNNNIEAALYIFPEGGHGWAMLDSFKYNKECLGLLDKWLMQFK